MFGRALPVSAGNERRLRSSTYKRHLSVLYAVTNQWSCKVRKVTVHEEECTHQHRLSDVRMRFDRPRAHAPFCLFDLVRVLLLAGWLLRLLLESFMMLRCPPLRERVISRSTSGSPGSAAPSNRGVYKEWSQSLMDQAVEAVLTRWLYDVLLSCTMYSGLYSRRPGISGRVQPGAVSGPPT